ncbi:hypothetical protein VIGAN_10147700 [Vigna angularis var. angularis]|uniref:Uncharacterized protein n=1 Tax=Vigna angularis var. angularis TaxID=157739 RepID=A0A0S3T428_PHAAN|nr:uncharacterized protein At1g76070-like isoform X2 [Vigna angularis]BAT99933.1 hypothetical protein VIGAN_10147700 [Vigna angularis var. angularis]
MEKLFQMRRSFLKFLTKQPATLVVAFQNPTPSPCRSPARMVSIIPREARRKRRGESFSTKEPTSPKVSCMGQVQGKKKRKARKQKKAQTQKDSTKTVDSVGELKKIVLRIRKGSDERQKHKVLEEKRVEAPSLNTMKKFASGRGSLYDFDVTIAESLKQIRRGSAVENNGIS